MIDYTLLPAVNATLNAISGIFLAIGYVLIKQRKISAHRNAMIAACTSSTLFLASYVTYHLHIGSRHFPGTGPIRLVYFVILISHVILAVVIVPMAVMTLKRGLGGDYKRHRTIARKTFPLWMYVSVTGVIVYWMLYQLY